MIQCANVTEAFIAMLTHISAHRYVRIANDPTSPKRGAEMLEAHMGHQYSIRHPEHNVVGCKSIDLKWTVQNILHFFSATENAAPLMSHKYAARFLTEDKWLGAYGAKAVPGINRCIDKLIQSTYTTRAIVNMTDLDDTEDVNRPHCWSALHFLADANGLNLIVYQRSLNLMGVMPYDGSLLCQILLYVAEATNIQFGKLIWTVGSLHAPKLAIENFTIKHGQRNTSVVLPAKLLSDPGKCYTALTDHSLLDAPYSEWLSSEGEIRT